MDSKNTLENSKSQTYRAILIHKILQNICTEKLAKGCGKQFDINAEIEKLSNKTVDNLDSYIEDKNEKDESEKIEDIYNDIVEIFKRDAKNSTDFYYNDLCKEVARCIVGCLIEPSKEACCENIFSINEAVYLLLDLDIDSVAIGWKNFSTCVDGAVDILLGGERSKIYDIRLVTLVETWFLEINNAVMDMHERVKRAIHAEKLKCTQDSTYYIRFEDLHEWAKANGVIINSGVNNDQISLSAEFIIIPKSIWANKSPLEVVADMRAGGFPEDAIAYTLYTWCGIQNKTEIDSIMRNKDISDSAKRKAVSNLLNMAEGRYCTQ